MIRTDELRGIIAKNGLSYTYETGIDHRYLDISAIDHKKEDIIDLIYRKRQ